MKEFMNFYGNLNFAGVNFHRDVRGTVHLTHYTIIKCVR